MEYGMQESSESRLAGEGDPTCRIRVWDLPTRLFHWMLVLSVTVCFVTGNIGGTAMSLHISSGLTVLGLLIFRLVWGFVGGRQSRFTAFVRGPREVIRYAVEMLRGRASAYLGHNPLGGWSILAMLLALAVQAATGLFSSDDILTEGPLVHLVDSSIVYQLTRIHRLNRIVVIVLAAIHILAVFFYLVVKRDNLLKPMITGNKDWSCDADASSGNLWAAAAIAGLVAAGVYFLGN
jgi:cytochrome b